MSPFHFVRVVFFLLCCTLVACSSSAPTVGSAALKEQEMIEALGRAAVVTTGTPRLDRSKPSTISWLGSLDVSGQHPTLSAEQLRQRVSTLINQQIMSRGYAVVSEDGDFQLQGVLVLADSDDSERVLRESGGLDPGLTSSQQLPGKGSLVLELKQGRISRWKGSVQIYIAPQYEQAAAARRIEHAVNQLLSTWP